MRKLLFLLFTAAMTTLGVHAVTVNNTAGQLSQLVQNTQISQLTVTGTMDARDFLFITDELTDLTSLDLSQVTILPVDGSKVLYGTLSSFAGNEIPRTAFFGKKLTSVALPSTVEVIGYAAFAGCYQLSSITLPASLTYIDDFAFAGTALTSIELPATVKGLGRGVFSRCESLVSANINSYTISDYAFLGDFNLSNVQIGREVKSIGKGAFNGCRALTTVNFDPKCTMSRINEEAFINSGLQQIDIKNLGLGAIGDWAFAQTELRSIDLTDGMNNLGEGALAHNRHLAHVSLPGLRDMSGAGPDSKADKSKLEPKVGPRFSSFRPHLTLERVSNYAFAGDTLLNAGNLLTRGVLSIGDYAFYNVSQEIDTMFLPATITWLGDYAMAGMTGMKNLKTAAEEVPELGENVWAGVNQPSVPLLTPSNESTAMYKAADQWMYFFFKNDFTWGDVNDDGFVNISDAILLINYILNDNPEGINLDAANVNDDDEVSISDAIVLINYVLNSNSKKRVDEIHSAIVDRYDATSDELVIPSVSLRPGETRTINVSLNNTERSYSAMQCELILPQGVTLTAVEGIDRGNGHDFYMQRHEAEQNVYTLMGLSMNMANFNSDEGNVLRLTVTAGEDFNPDNAEVELANVQLVTAKSNIYLAGSSVTRLNDVTAVEHVTVVNEVAAVRYINVAGQESDTPFAGVNIMVTTYTDGTTSTMKVIK